MPDAALWMVMYLVYPMWVAAAFADALCHRATDIAHTSGLRENLLHWLMFFQVALALSALAFLELNAAVLALWAIIFALHELTVYWDLDYSTVRRDVAPFEQMAHSFLELLPLLTLALLALSAWPQALAMVGLGDAAPDWSLRPRSAPFPLSYLGAALALSALFNILPLLAETWICVKARRHTAQAATRATAAAGARVEPRL